MSRIDMDAETAPVGWAAFFMKLVLAATWAAVIGLGAWLLEQPDGASRVAGGLCVAAPAFLWLTSLLRRSRIDELENRLAVQALAQGGWWAVSFGATLYGLMAAIGRPPAAEMLVFLPWGAFVFGEIMAQTARLHLARR